MARRPEELLYAVDERPPALRLVALGLQHAVLMSVYLVIVVVIAKAAKAPPQVVMDMLACGLLALAAASVLQALRLGPVGSGYLAVPVFSAIFLGPSVLAAEAGGLALVFGMTLVAGLVQVLLSRFLARLRAFFPPAVSGFIVCIVGIELGLVGVRHGLSMDDFEAGAPGYPGHLLAAAATLFVAIGLSVWGRGIARLVCSLVGLLVGALVAVAFGLTTPEAAAALAAAPWIALPAPDAVAWDFDLALLPAFVAAGIAATLRTIGVITSCQKLNDADWKRPELRSLKGGTAADGLGCMLSALCGAPGLNAGPSLVGVSGATRATSRWIAYAAGAILAAMAFVPKFGAFFLALPEPVAGGMLMFTAALMVAGGIGIMVSRPLDTRATFVIGLAFLLSLSTKVYPQFFTGLPPLLRTFAGGALEMGVLVSVLLTLVFRLGVRRTALVRLEGEGAESDLPSRIRREGRSWKLGAELVERAAASTAEALRQLQAADSPDRPVACRLTWNELDLVVDLIYEGRALSLPDLQRQRRDADEETAFAQGLATYLTGVYPDRLETRSDRDRTLLRLVFAA